jgi:phenylpropionate dioxygenase-like ring-hydroxylating dioxygenase large terminal subunit
MNKINPEREKQVTQWANYDALEGGLRDYWYPVMRSRALRRKPVPMQLFGEQVVFVREGKRAFALVDRCPHRGTPLRFGKRDFPGTLTCIYHGWCFDLATGKLVAALTDGPDCPIVGKVSVQTYPVDERLGFVWIYMGTEPPPPLEANIPEEFFDPDMVMCIRMSEQVGNWRFAVENHFDDSHAQYLHRFTPYSLFWYVPTYKRGIRVLRNGPWLEREYDSLHFGADYPGLGRWPKEPFWKRKATAAVHVRMPGTGRVVYKEFTAYKFQVPITVDRFLFVQLVTRKVRGLRAWFFRLQYWLYRRWLYHVLFNNDDVMMTTHSHTGPERLFGPDISITAWRKMCIDEARGRSARTPAPAE